MNQCFSFAGRIRLRCLTRRGSEEFEEVDESCHGEDVAQVGVHALDVDVAAFRLGVLEHAKEEAESAGGDVVECCAVEDDVLPGAVVERLQVLFALWCGGGVETTFENGNEFVVLLLDGCFHDGTVYIVYVLSDRSVEWAHGVHSSEPPPSA